MKKRIFCLFFALLLIVNLTFCNYKQAQAVWIAPAIPEGVAVLVKVLLGIGVTCGVVNEAYENYENMTDEEKIKAYNEEQQYLQSMQTYMIDGSFGSTEYCSVMTADGQVLTLAEALETATSMSQAEYIDMRKETNSPNPTKTPGINWGEIFIDSAVGGLMDFVSSFLTDKKVETGGAVKPYTTYVGDNGYKNFSDRSVVAFYECDAATSQGIVKFYNYKTYSYPYNNIADNYKSKAFSNYRMAIYLDTSRSEFFDGFGRAPAFVMKTTLTSTGDVAGSAVCGSFTYAFSGSTPTSFTYMSTNMPIFTSLDECNAYLKGGSSGNRFIPPHPFPAINTTCNNYKNKVVSVNSVRSYGVTPTPKPTATPRPTATSKPTATPTPTPYPTWDKESGNGTNFTNYNFYTEVSNSFVNVQTTLNNISQSVTNIYNFFQIDTQEISYQMNFDSPAYKFDSVNKNISALKSAFGSDSYDDNTGLLKADYPKISMKCPKILEPIVDTVGEDGIKEIVIVDFKDYALWFIRLRKFLEAIMWIGMVFLLMKEIKVVFTV